MIGQKIAIDIGSKNITVYVEGKGITLCEPSCMAVDRFTGRAIAAGIEAKRAEGKTPSSIDIIYPIENGRINDYDRTVGMLRDILNRFSRGRILRPNVLLCVPGTVTELDKKTIFDAVVEAGAGKVCFVDQTLASAAGAGINLARADAVIVLDIGASASDCAVIAGGNVVISDFRRTGGGDLNEALVSYVAKKYDLILGAEAAEELKKTIGSAVMRDEEVTLVVCGKDARDFCPRETEVSSKDLLEAFEPALTQIAELVTGLLENVSPTVSADVYESGVILTGGGANLYGLDKLISEKTGVKTTVPDSPDLCAALGMGKLLDDLDFLSKHDYIFRTNRDNYIDE